MELDPKIHTLIDEILQMAKNNLIEIKGDKHANSYAAGFEAGTIDTCRELLVKIKELPE